MRKRHQKAEADNAQLRSTLARREKELTDTKRALKETKDLVNAVKTELAILSKMKKDRRAKEKKTEFEFTAEYLKEMEKLRDQLRDAVKENHRLKNRLEQFQVAENNQTSPNGSKTRLGQEVHVHHDCEAVQQQQQQQRQQQQRQQQQQQQRDRSAPGTRPPTAGGSSRPRRRSHSSSEGEE